MQTGLFHQQEISHCDGEKERICMDAGHVTKQHGSYSNVVMGSGRLREMKE